MLYQQSPADSKKPFAFLKVSNPVPVGNKMYQMSKYGLLMNNRHGNRIEPREIEEALVSMDSISRTGTGKVAYGDLPNL